jgi:hypothetical protein
LKIAPHIVAVPLCCILNNVIQSGEIPEAWKEARVLPIYKKKGKSKVENYRPISILPTPSKIMEEIFQKQHSKYVEKSGILPPNQFGFRAGVSTNMANGVAQHEWQKAKMEGKACGVVQFDLSSAFDVINIDILLGKLEVYGASSLVLKTIQSYLTGPCHKVEYDGEQSDIIYMKVGSPQGSKLSPLLYLIMIADQNEWILDGFLLIYADDTLGYVIANTREEVRAGLESMACQVLGFYEATKLKANTEKTCFMMFGSKKEDPIQIGTTLVEESQELEFLGLKYNKRLTWKSQLEKIEGELRSRIGVLRRVSWHLPRKVAINMVEPLFTSKLRYALELYCIL